MCNNKNSFLMSLLKYRIIHIVSKLFIWLLCCCPFFRSYQFNILLQTTTKESVSFRNVIHSLKIYETILQKLCNLFSRCSIFLRCIVFSLFNAFDVRAARAIPPLTTLEWLFNFARDVRIMVDEEQQFRTIKFGKWKAIRYNLIFVWYVNLPVNRKSPLYQILSINI